MSLIMFFLIKVTNGQYGTERDITKDTGSEYNTQ